MIEECRKAGIPEPEFESRASSFRIVFRKAVAVDQRFAGLGLNERQLAGLRYLQTRGRITMQEYAKATDCSERTAKRDLKEMVEKKVLVRHGRTKGSWYELSRE